MDKWMEAVVWIYGLSLGSFYNVVGLRLAEGKLFEKSRSYCPNCSWTLDGLELVPLVSYVIQRGKCKGCKESISLVYPFFEGLTAGLFWLSWLKFGFSLQFLFALCLISFLIPLTVSDVHYLKIPNSLLVFFGPPLLLLSHFSLEISLGSKVGAFALLTAVFSALFFFRENGMGMGDVKLLLLLACIFGTEFSLRLLFLSSTLALVWFGLLFFLKKDISALKLPFGPFISAAAFLLFFLWH